MIDNEHESNDLTTESADGRLIRVGAGAVMRDGIFYMPPDAHGLVILPHGIAASRQHKITLVRALHEQRLATFVVDLFNNEERALDQQTDFFRRNTDIMQQRLVAIAEWFAEDPQSEHLAVGYFGMDETGAAVLIAAAERPDLADAVVAAGGDIDQARASLPGILAPTLLIAPAQDQTLVKFHQDALAQLPAEKQLELVQNATALSQSDQALAEVTRLATAWFAQRLVTVM